MDAQTTYGQLARLAVTAENSRGRRHSEEPHPYRCDFERDRDRVIHSSAFRRLEGKTQVFTPGLDDYYRTRLTHSIEVAQIGRTIAKALGLNEVLTEAICLAHDLGHAPFGHAGEKVLGELMADFGGFEHNIQALRIVDVLEHPYPQFQGLNLMHETRLALARHHSPYDKPEGDDFAEKNCSLEGQIANVADRIAYNCHDLEDGLRARLIENEQLESVEIFRAAQEAVGAAELTDYTIRRTRTAKAIMNTLVGDCIATTVEAAREARVETTADVTACDRTLVAISEAADSRLTRLEAFLLENMYHHRLLVRWAGRIEIWLGELFGRLCGDPTIMPGYFQVFIGAHGLERAVCDYIAGMTDRFCLKLLGVDPSALPRD